MTELLLGEVTPEVAEFLRQHNKKDFAEPAHIQLYEPRPCKRVFRYKRHNPSTWRPKLVDNWPEIHDLSTSKLRLEEQFLHELGERVVNRMENL